MILVPHTIPVSYQGEKKQLAFTTLANGMKLGVVAPGNEIYAFQKEAIYRAFFLLLLFAIITSAIAIYLANRILRPPGGDQRSGLPDGPGKL